MYGCLHANVDAKSEKLPLQARKPRSNEEKIHRAQQAEAARSMIRKFVRDDIALSPLVTTTSG